MSIKDRKKNNFNYKTKKIVDKIWVILFVFIILGASVYYSNKFEKEEKQINNIIYNK